MNDVCNIFWQINADNKETQQQNKGKIKKKKKINTADQKHLSFDCYVSKNTLFSEPPGVNKTPKIVLNGRKPLWNSIQFDNHTKQHNPLPNTRFCNIFPQIKANNKETQQQNKTKTRKRQTPRTIKFFIRLLYLKRLISRASRSQRNTKNYTKWKQTFTKQQSIPYNQTKQHNPLTNARFWNMFWQIKADNKETKTTKQQKKREKRQTPLWTALFPEPPGVDETSKTILNESEPLWNSNPFDIIKQNNTVQ